MKDDGYNRWYKNGEECRRRRVSRQKKRFKIIEALGYVALAMALWTIFALCAYQTATSREPEPTYDTRHTNNGETKTK